MVMILGNGPIFSELYFKNFDVTAVAFEGLHRPSENAEREQVMFIQRKNMNVKRHDGTLHDFIEDEEVLKKLNSLHTSSEKVINEATDFCNKAKGEFNDMRKQAYLMRARNDIKCEMHRLDAIKGLFRGLPQEESRVCEKYQEILQRDQSLLISALLTLSDILEVRYQYTAAIECLDQIIQLQALHYDALFRRAYIFQLLKNFSRAWNDVCVLAENYPDDLEVQDMYDEIKYALRERPQQQQQQGIGNSIPSANGGITVSSESRLVEDQGSLRAEDRLATRATNTLYNVDLFELGVDIDELFPPSTNNPYENGTLNFMNDVDAMFDPSLAPGVNIPYERNSVDTVDTLLSAAFPSEGAWWRGLGHQQGQQEYISRPSTPSTIGGSSTFSVVSASDRTTEEEWVGMDEEEGDEVQEVNEDLPQVDVLRLPTSSSSSSHYPREDHSALIFHDDISPSTIRSVVPPEMVLGDGSNETRVLTDVEGRVPQLPSLGEDNHGVVSEVEVGLLEGDGQVSPTCNNNSNYSSLAGRPLVTPPCIQSTRTLMPLDGGIREEEEEETPQHDGLYPTRTTHTPGSSSVTATSTPLVSVQQTGEHALLPSFKQTTKNFDATDSEIPGGSNSTSSNDSRKRKLEKTPFEKLPPKKRLLLIHLAAEKQRKEEEIIRQNNIQQQWLERKTKEDQAKRERQ